MKCARFLVNMFMLFSVAVNEKLPKEKLIIGYGTSCDNKIIESVKNGVNVIIWFAIHLVSDAYGNPIIRDESININCIANIYSQLKNLNLPITNLVSIGGWNAPHVDTKFSAETWWNILNNWNLNKVAVPDLGFNGFDGLDIDIEGNDDKKSELNYFTAVQLDTVGKLCQLAKFYGGWTISLAPTLSYFDHGTNDFSLSLLFAPAWKPDFTYDGLNPYAYIYHRYNEIKKCELTGINQLKSVAVCNPDEIIETFDFISFQLYESFSRAYNEVNYKKTPLSSYLLDFIGKCLRGWEVKFSQEKSVDYPDNIVTVSREKIVIGLCNAWGVGSDRAIFLHPEELEVSYNYLKSIDLEPRGFMFYFIGDEGKEIVYKGRKENLYLAEGINKFLKIRK